MSNDIENTENNNVNTSSKSSSHKNISCEKSSIVPAFTISDVKDLVVDLNNISIFLNSGAWQRDTRVKEWEVLEVLFDGIKSKLEILDRGLLHIDS